MKSSKGHLPKQKDAGDLLKKMRLFNRMTQQQLADAMEDRFGVQYSVSQISRFEKGENAQTVDYIMHCCDILDVHPLSFMIGLLHEDRHWKTVSIAVNSGAFFYDLITDNFREYGEQLLTLTDDDLEMIQNFIQFYLRTRFLQKQRSEPMPRYLDKISKNVTNP